MALAPGLEFRATFGPCEPVAFSDFLVLRSQQGIGFFNPKAGAGVKVLAGAVRGLCQYGSGTSHGAVRDVALNQQGWLCPRRFGQEWLNPWFKQGIGDCNSRPLDMLNLKTWNVESRVQVLSYRLCEQTLKEGAP